MSPKLMRKTFQIYANYFEKLQHDLSDALSSQQTVLVLVYSHKQHQSCACRKVCKQRLSNKDEKGSEEERESLIIK